jgi:hypothetical protein
MSMDATSGAAASGQTIVAVVGVPRSGTSCIAGMLHNMGICMGKRLMPPQPYNPKGFFEAMYLQHYLMACFEEPTLRELAPRSERVEWLTHWAAGRRGEGPVVGAKHPAFCLILPDLAEAWPGVRIVCVDRPYADIIASLTDPALQSPSLGTKAWFAAPIQAKSVAAKLDKRDQDLATLNLPTLRLAYYDVLRDPGSAADALAAFAGIQPTENQRAAAIAHVDQTLRHHGQPTSEAAPCANA